MHVEYREDGWRVSLDAGLVQMIQIDFRLGLIMSGDDDMLILHIETPFCFKRNGQNTILNPSESENLAPILSLFNKSISHIEVKRTGHIELFFADTYSIECDSNMNYEAWQFSCVGKFLLVCLPGGAVSFFPQDGMDLDHGNTVGFVTMPPD
ncbi:MAG: DUF6188 family protein [Aliidongia sp.]